MVLADQGARAAYRQARQRTGAGRLVLVTVPFTAAGGPLARLGRRTRLAWLTARLRRLPDVALGWVPDGVASPRPFPAQDGACTTIVSVPEADLRARRGLAVGRLFGCQEIRAVHVDLDRRPDRPAGRRLAGARLRH